MPYGGFGESARPARGFGVGNADRGGLNDLPDLAICNAAMARDMLGAGLLERVVENVPGHELRAAGQAATTWWQASAAAEVVAGHRTRG